MPVLPDYSGHNRPLNYYKHNYNLIIVNFYFHLEKLLLNKCSSQNLLRMHFFKFKLIVTSSNIYQTPVIGDNLKNSY